MAPKESAAAKAARLQRQAVVLQQQATLEKVKAILASRPDLVQLTLNHLESLTSDTNLPIASSPGTPRFAADLDGAESSCDHDGPSTPSSKASSAEIGAAVAPARRGQPDDVPECHTSIETLSVKFLKLLLFNTEPVSFSPFAIKAMAKRGSRDASKANLCELIEFVTSIEPTVTISGDERKWENLVQRMADLNAARGHLGRNLPLPPDWQQNGFYKIVCTDPELTIQSLAGKQIQAQAAMLAAVPDRSQIFIAKNFSQKRAAIQAEGTFLNELIFFMFTAPFATKAAAKADVGRQAAAEAIEGPMQHLGAQPAQSSGLAEHPAPQADEAGLKLPCPKKPRVE